MKGSQEYKKDQFTFRSDNYYAAIIHDTFLAPFSEANNMNLLSPKFHDIFKSNSRLPDLAILINIEGLTNAIPKSP